jgi:hypothetical protein
MAVGDHIYVHRLGGIYSHHGIDVGDGAVVHYTGDDWLSSRVRRSSLAEFTIGHPVRVRSYVDFQRAASLEELVVRETNRRVQALGDRLFGRDTVDRDPSPEAVVARAGSRLGEGGFDFLFNNCEHFATWCKTGIRDSRQIEAIWKFALNPPKYALIRMSSWLTASLDRSSRPPQRA